MSALTRDFFKSERTRWVFALGSVALVLLLSILANNPALHRLFHADHDLGTDDSCAVVLFAQGVSAPLDTAVLAGSPTEWVAGNRTEVLEIVLTSPRYLHQPERGPPVS